MSPPPVAVRVVTPLTVLTVEPAKIETWPLPPAEFAQKTIGPPFDCMVTAALLMIAPVALKVTAALEPLEIVLVAIVMSPPVEVIAIPFAPAEVIAPVPLKLRAVTETEPFAFKVPAPVYAPLPITVMFPLSVVLRFEPTATAPPQTSMFPLIAAGVEMVIADVLPDLPKAK